jgi:predicted MFS family arabinose efflux permease
MKEGVEGGHEEIPSRHPLAALSFGALLTFVSGRVRRGARVAERSAKPEAEQEPAVADRTGIRSLLTAQAVGQVGNLMVFVAGPWFVLETTGSAARTGIVSGALAMGAVIPAVLGGPLVDRLGFKRSSVLADLASAAAVAAVPLLHLMRAERPVPGRLLPAMGLTKVELSLQFLKLVADCSQVVS